MVGTEGGAALQLQQAHLVRERIRAAAAAAVPVVRLLVCRAGDGGAGGGEGGSLGFLWGGGAGGRDGGEHRAKEPRSPPGIQQPPR